MVSRLLVLGCGYAGVAIAQRARAQDLAVLAFVRRAEAAAIVQSKGLNVRVMPSFDHRIAADVDEATHVVVAFPPDGVTDQRVAPALRSAAAITYLSTTSVYETIRGVIDDATPLPTPSSDRARRVLDAETAYRDYGATVLRCAAIYGPDRGLHRRVLTGIHQIPGDGRRFVSRIHVDDLATVVLATASVRAETFVVGDQGPAPHGDVVHWICAHYGVPVPPSIPLEDAPLSLRADRQIDPSRLLGRLGVTLRYPTYREGMASKTTEPGANAENRPSTRSP